MLFELLFCVGIALYGAVALWKRRADIGIGRPKPIFTFQMNGITAVTFGLGLILGGIAIALPSGYQLASGNPLAPDLSNWMPTIGLVIIVIGIIGASLSGILRTAKAAGDSIFTRNPTRDHEGHEPQR